MCQGHLKYPGPLCDSVPQCVGSDMSPTRTLSLTALGTPHGLARQSMPKCAQLQNDAPACAHYLDSSASGNVECVATCHACENTLGNRPPPPLHRLSNQGTEDITAVAMQLQYSRAGCSGGVSGGLAVWVCGWKRRIASQAEHHAPGPQVQACPKRGIGFQ